MKSPLVLLNLLTILEPSDGRATLPQRLPQSAEKARQKPRPTRFMESPHGHLAKYCGHESRDWRSRESVLDCASPLALWHLLEPTQSGPDASGPQSKTWRTIERFMEKRLKSFLLWAGLAIWPGLMVAALAAPVQLNEIMARNAAAVADSAGRYVDWIELANPNPFEVALAGLRVGNDPTNTWPLPAGSRIGAAGFLVVWFDASRPGSIYVEPNLNSGQSLPGNGGVYLFDASNQLIDSVTYGFQLVDLSIGRANGQWQLLSAPTPGAANASPAALGSTANLRLNEWMANPVAGSDWFELYNLNAQPVDLAGLFLSDDPSKAGQTKFQIASLSYIGAQNWVKWTADNKTNNGLDHVNFKLPAGGGSLCLYSVATNLLDRIDYSQQQIGVSEGRLPDGGATIVKFETTPTPGEDNYLPLTSVIINEVLTHTDPPLEDAVELYNPNSTNLSIGGWFLSNQPDNLKRYRIPEGTVIPGHGYLVLYEYQFINPSHFTFNSAHGDRAYLSTGDAFGNLTGYRTKVTFGSAAKGISFGQFVTSVGTEFVAMSQLTLGTEVKSTDPPDQISVFRSGQGAPNSYPLVGPVVITEIMYHPPSWEGTNSDNLLGEFVELHNPTLQNVPLFDLEYPTNTWKLEGGITFQFPRYLTMPPGSFWLLVSFDPQTNPAALAEFQKHYPLSDHTTLLGPYEGKLQNSGDTLMLYKPDPVQQPPHPDAGYVPYVLVEKINFKDAYPWRNEADGGGASLQRKGPLLFGNDPANWTAGPPHPGSGDSDQDGMPDIWEVAHGFNPLDASDAMLDADQDGLTNLQEYLAGTDPRDHQSLLRLLLNTAPDKMISIQFAALATKSYSLLWTTNIAPGAWINLTNITASYTNRWIEITNLFAPRYPQVFYRLLTPQQELP